MVSPLHLIFDELNSSVTTVIVRDETIEELLPEMTSALTEDECICLWIEIPGCSKLEFKFTSNVSPSSSSSLQFIAVASSLEQIYTISSKGQRKEARLSSHRQPGSKLIIK